MHWIFEAQHIHISIYRKIPYKSVSLSCIIDNSLIDMAQNSLINIDILQNFLIDLIWHKITLSIFSVVALPQYQGWLGGWGKLLVQIFGPLSLKLVFMHTFDKNTILQGKL